MLILAFDSTAKTASVALTENEKLLADFVYDNGLTQSELLLPMAEEALKKVGRSFSDVDLFACNVGPGSFTGVRIGVALIKGLAFNKNTPCVPVSTLESLAEGLMPLENGILCPCMDARKGQVYNALFVSSGDGLTRLTEDRAISLSDLATELSTLYKEKPIRLAGDGYDIAYKALSDAGLQILPTPELLKRQNAYTTARIAYRLACNGNTVSPATLSPLYLRMPQAESDRLKAKEK